MFALPFAPRFLKSATGGFAGSSASIMDEVLNIELV
jgi:hypothetical protein